MSMASSTIETILVLTNQDLPSCFATILPCNGLKNVNGGAKLLPDWRRAGREIPSWFVFSSHDTPYIDLGKAIHRSHAKMEVDWICKSP